MKLMKIFKKAIGKTSKNGIQILDKKQLQKVNGGADVSSSDKTLVAHELTHVVQQK